jgi:hypothetical protein
MRVMVDACRGAEYAPRSSETVSSACEGLGSLMSL